MASGTKKNTSNCHSIILFIYLKKKTENKPGLIKKIIQKIRSLKSNHKTITRSQTTTHLTWNRLDSITIIKSRIIDARLNLTGRLSAFTTRVHSPFRLRLKATFTRATVTRRCLADNWSKQIHQSTTFGLSVQSRKLYGIGAGLGFLWIFFRPDDGLTDGRNVGFFKICLVLQLLVLNSAC